MAGRKPGALSHGTYELRRYNRHQVEALLNGYLRLPFKHIKHLYEDDDLPSLDRLIVSIIFKAVETGDHLKLNALLDRMGIILPKTDENVIDIDRLPLSEAIQLAKETVKALEKEAKGGV